MNRLVAITLEGRHITAVRKPDGLSVLCAETGTPGDDAVFERIELSHGRVALRSSDGSYLALHARHEGGDSEGSPHLSSELTQCAAFEEVLLPGGQVSLRGCDLRYLGVHRNGQVIAERVVNGSRERFTYVEVPARPPAAPAPVTGPVTAAVSPVPAQPGSWALRTGYAAV